MISFGLWIAGLFGKTPTAEAARKLGAIVGGVLALVALVIAIFIGIRMHDNGVREAYQDKRDAAVANATVVADREALANAQQRANVAEAENDAISNAMVEAKAKDPEKGQREVGPVTQSYFDSLPKRKH